MTLPPQGQFGSCTSCGTPFNVANPAFCPACGVPQSTAQIPLAAAPWSPPAAPTPPPAAPWTPVPYQQPGWSQPQDPNQQQNPYQQPVWSQPQDPNQQQNPYLQPPYYGQQPGWGAPPAGGSNRSVIAAAIGAIVVVAMVVGIVIVGVTRNNSTADATAFPAYVAPPTPIIVSASPTPATQGWVTFTPTILMCSDPVDFTETATLPASVTPGDVLIEKFDGNETSTFTADSTYMTQLLDGSWQIVSTATAAQMQTDCANSGLNSTGLAVLTPGDHTLAYYTEAGGLLAQGVYTVMSSGTESTPAPSVGPSPAGAGNITFSPSTMVCSSPETFVTTIRLPATVKSGDTVTEKLDNATYATGVISTESWTKLADGSWSSTTSAAATSVTTACEADNGVMSIGTHHVEIVDAHGVLLAENWYTVAP